MSEPLIVTPQDLAGQGEYHADVSGRRATSCEVILMFGLGLIELIIIGLVGSLLLFVAAVIVAAAVGKQRR